ncbi:MAG: hypothetical protein LV481_13240 [Methylacidiphilales bacterium]|nr:hypothetical protein [Candidatus Methylacidiphilales bacterium]
MRKRMAGLCWVLVALTMINASADARTEQPYLKNAIKASLIFETSPKHPTHLQVYLHLVDVDNALNEWLADPGMGVEAELLDPSGKPAGWPPGGWNLALISSPYVLTLPGGSRLDLLISHDWGVDDPSGGYVLGINYHIWFIPKDKVGSYTLRIKFPGVFPVPVKTSPAPKPWILFDIPPQKIVISKSLD